MNSTSRFDQLTTAALSEPFSGWDFSFLNGRVDQLNPTWSYRELVAAAISDAVTLLDMCTGGGEFLDDFNALPTATFATEGYSANVPVAAARLSKRGVTIVKVDSDDELPLDSDFFDLITNRHGTFSPLEMKRISRPSGARFITQQVGSGNCAGINQALTGASPDCHAWALECASDSLQAQGFRIVRGEEEYPVMAFRDIGALVYYLKAIPWQVPDFSLSKYRQELLDIHAQIESEGAFEVATHRFLIEAEIF